MSTSANAMRQKILKEGKMDIEVRHSSMLQRLEFKIVREKMPVGEVPFAKVERWVDATELLRVATELDLPVLAPTGRFFPPKRKASDYAGL